MSGGFMFMAARYCKKAMLLFFIVFVLLSSADAVHGWRRLSKEEDVEIDRQLKLINKPAVKSFRTEYGDILDCVDIFKQHAFDHPLLKNHTIQMKPETAPKGMKDKGASSTEASSLFLHKNVSCPQGTVPIRRTQKEDLIMAKYFSSFPRTYPTNIHSPRVSLLNLSTHHFAVLEYKKSNYGAKGRMNVWKPKVTADQFSTGSIWLVNGPRDQINSIQAGWMVHPPMYQNLTRMYIFWTADGYQQTGCFNLQCPGFIQVNSKITPDVALGQVSTYNGPQYELVISLHQDLLTGNWWLIYGEENIGYWPKSIFTSLASGAAAASWGGEIYSPLAEASPSMGSGHFAEEGYGKSCYISQIKVAHSGAFVDPDDDPPRYADLPKCYNVLHYIYKDNWGHMIYFGGPGQCKLQ